MKLFFTLCSPKVTPRLRWHEEGEEEEEEAPADDTHVAATAWVCPRACERLPWWRYFSKPRQKCVCVYVCLEE